MHKQWPGAGPSGDPAFAKFMPSQVPSLASFPRQQELNRDALVAAARQDRPGDSLTHSQSALVQLADVADAPAESVEGAGRLRSASVRRCHDIENTGEPRLVQDAEPHEDSGPRRGYARL